MNPNEQTNGNTPPMAMAGLAGLVCLPLIWMAASPLWKLHNARLAEWLALASFVLIPMSVTFVVLYLSSWHRESPRVRRIVSMILSTCLVYCVDVLVAGLLVVMGCLAIALTRVVGGN